MNFHEALIALLDQYKVEHDELTILVTSDRVRLRYHVEEGPVRQVLRDSEGSQTPN